MFEIKPIGTPFEAIDIARKSAPHLERLVRRFPQTFEELQTGNCQSLIKSAIEKSQSAAHLGMNEAMRDLRRAKGELHLALSAADLSQALPFMEIVGGLSDLADCALQSSLHIAIREAPPRDRPSLKEEDGKLIAPGLFILAMGKHGARELNYSSDVDLAAFFDREAFAEDYQYSATATCVRLIGQVSKIMEEITPDNYVFRVDWRLRPDPASTPLAVSTQAAEVYYESVGQNWERAAMIKARVIAGAQKTGEEFLDWLSPFIWRKYLDFAAIIDVGSILRQIHRIRRSTELDNPSFDVKLGRGGIREIEFFAQTQQLILGGKDRSLRQRQTIGALNALSNAGRISQNIAQDLSRAYIYLRNVEHRIQMIDDEQTHTLTENAQKRAFIAELCGFDSLSAFDKANLECRQLVREHIRGLFPETAPLSGIGGSLVFTGVDNDPETIETLSQMGFLEPKFVCETIRGWHHGRIRATRTARARELLTTITPDLLSAICATGEADVVFKRFDDFFSGLSAGVQTLALFSAEPQIMAETCQTLGLSNRLAVALANKPAILDAMLSPRFLSPLEVEAENAREELLFEQLSHANDFELALDIMRRFHREEAFRIGFHILHGRASAAIAGHAYSNLAIACVRAALPLAMKEVAKNHGDFAGSVVVCGWGKLGANELSADSDLDLMLIYEPQEGVEQSTGARPLSAESYFAKLTQKLIQALSVPTSEGSLYEVDMQLRPSGKKGPVAVRFSSFENYYEQEAWTWEFQALTRLTPIAGDISLSEKITKVARAALCRERDENKTMNDITQMREKIRAAHKPRGTWDLKRLDGGLVELEFITQAYELVNAPKFTDVISPNTIDALHKLAREKAIDFELAQRLSHSGEALNKIRQILAIVAGNDFEPQKASNSTKSFIAAALDAPDFGTAQAVLDDARAVIHEHWKQILQKYSSQTTENMDLPVE